MCACFVLRQLSGSTDVQLLQKQLCRIDPALKGKCSDNEDRAFIDVNSDLGSWANDQRGLSSFLGRALRRRRIFLLYLSKGVFERPWCQWEVRVCKTVIALAISIPKLIL